MSRRTHSQRTTRACRNGQAAACLLSAGALLIALFSGSARGEGRVAHGFVLIVNPANPTRSVTEEFLTRAFFKRATRWEHGAPIHPVDQRLGSPIREAFSNDLLKRSPEAVRGYWLQRIFSGRDVPPLELDSDAAVIRYVMSAPGAVGYVAATTNPAPAKVLTVD